MNPEHISKVYQMAIQDIGRYYFVAYSILKDPSVYEQIAFSPDETTAVLMRKTGTLQIVTVGECVSPSSGVWLQGCIGLMAWTSVVALKMHLEFLTNSLEGSQFRQGSFIAKCAPSQWQSPSLKQSSRVLEVDDLECVEVLYKDVFKGYAPVHYMKEKLESGRGRGRGRGVIIKDKNSCVGVAQSDFETPEMALIVGVASAVSHRGQGYGKACMVELGDALVKEGKSLCLIYENPIAGHLYAQLGFEVYDRVYHLERKSI